MAQEVAFLDRRVVMQHQQAFGIIQEAAECLTMNNNRRK
jgi:hypothetical protein